MRHKNGTIPKMAIITDKDGDGITSAAQLYRYYSKTGFRKKKKQQHRTYECEVFYATNSTLQDRLSKIGPDIDELIITDLGVKDEDNFLEELYRITKNKCKVTILSDKKMPPSARLIDEDYITVESANKIENTGKSTSLIVYDYLEKASEYTLDNVYDSLADMGAAADGVIGGTKEYRKYFEKAKKLDYAIRENKEDNQFFNNILHELANYGSIQKKYLLDKIENKSNEFSNRIKKAYNAVINEKNILCQNENYLISRIDVKRDDVKLPYSLACSQIRHEEEKNIVLIYTGINNHAKMILRGYNSNNFSDLRDNLKIYDLKGGGHAGIRCKGSYEFDLKHIDSVVKEIRYFCSKPPKN